jgi:hypothetical protein
VQEPISLDQSKHRNPVKLVDVYWALPVNRLRVVCDCGSHIDTPSNFSLAICPRCRRAELWHSVDPRPVSGPWSEPVMENVVR